MTMIYGIKFIDLNIEESNGTNILVEYIQEKWTGLDLKLRKVKNYVNECEGLSIGAVVDRGDDPDEGTIVEIIVGVEVDGTLESIQNAAQKIQEFDLQVPVKLMNRKSLDKVFKVYHVDFMGRREY